MPATCWHKNATCNFCHKKGHISTACKGKKKTDGKPRSHYRKGTHHVEDEGDDDTFTMHSLSLNAVTGRSTHPWIVKPELEGVTIPMEVDTGSPITLIPEEIWTKTLNLPLQPSDLKLISYTKNPLNLRGKCEVNVGLNGHKMLLTVHVARKGGATLMGRDWLRKIRLNWDELKIHHLSSPISTLIDRYGSLFSEEQGELKGFTAHLTLKEGAQPSYISAREIPYAMREIVEADLDRLVKRGVIYKVKHSKWASPIVVVPKPDNAIRVCGDYKPTDPEVKQYFSSRRDLTIEGDCLLRGLRVVIPTKLHTKLLEELHSSHQGVVKMKSLARCHIWWPQIDKDIEHLARSCPTCQSNAKMPGEVIRHPWVWPERPFQRIHIDFAGPFLNLMFLLLVDAHSKWLEVIPMKTTTSQKTIDALSDIFARFGLPELLVSDNGPQFVSREFQEWLARQCIQHIRSSPYHPQSNGAAERCVQTFKNALLKAVLRGLYPEDVQNCADPGARGRATCEVGFFYYV